MSDKKKNEPSKTDSLIEEAIAESDSEIVHGPLVDELSEPSQSGDLAASESEEELSSTDARRREAVAKIDLQQFVEKEAYMRLAADFDNFRKRALKERQEWERQGRDKILRGFLEVLDNLVRGIEQAGEDDSALAEGMRMVLSQAEAWLKAEGLERIETLGKAFDPALHEAVAKIEDPSKADGMILEEIRRGYRWNDRLLRPASVVVSKSDAGDKLSKGQE